MKKSDIGRWMTGILTGCLISATALGQQAADGVAAPARRPVAFSQFEYSGEDIDAHAPLEPGTFRTAILAGHHPDPSLCRAGDYYYLVTSTFSYFPGLPIFQSRDLVNWTLIGHAIHRPEQLAFTTPRTSAGLFAPTITYNPKQGLFYVLCTMVYGLGNFVVTATNPAGPWSDPVRLDFGGIDPGLFFNDDGRAWIIHNDMPKGKPLYEGHRAVWIQEFDYKNLRMIGPRTMLIDGGVDIATKPIWIEAPHIYERDGWYYLTCAEGGTSVNHTQVIFRSRNVDGPYVPWERNPILTQRDLDSNVRGSVTCVGHADMIIGPDGNWWAVFLAVRPYDGHRSPMGRETFLLPVTWPENEWPVILPQGQRVPLVLPSPNGAVVDASPAIPFNGSFTWRYDFTAPELSLEWIMVRAPKETWWRLRPEAGRLELTPRAEKLTGRGNPSYLGRRVRHPVYSASLSVEMPSDEGVSAGLALFLNDRHHYFLAVHRDGGQPRIYLESVNRGKTSRVAVADLPSSAKEISLRVDARKAVCSFHYRLPGGDWQTLVADADARIICFTVQDGLFLGATVGPHARMD